MDRGLNAQVRIAQSHQQQIAKRIFAHVNECKGCSLDIQGAHDVPADFQARCETGVMLGEEYKIATSRFSDLKLQEAVRLEDNEEIDMEGEHYAR